MLLKDNIDATPMVNSAGSLALADHRPQDDAFIVRRLREAGAVILGKTNLTEWANIRSSRSTSGWTARGGQTRNPYALAPSSCGPSRSARRRGWKEGVSTVRHRWAHYHERTKN